MIAVQEALPEPAKLAQAIKERILVRTSGRIHGLAVEIAEGRVGVHGRAASFHLKQLALQGVIDVIGSVARMRIELDIQVDDRKPDAPATVHKGEAI